jgi:hypothetical protein
MVVMKLFLLLVIDRGLVGDDGDYVIVGRDERKAKKISSVMVVVVVNKYRWLGLLCRLELFFFYSFLFSFFSLFALIFFFSIFF